MISIIIPAYNSRATIVEALDSVLAQTLWGGREAVDGRLATCVQNGFDGAKPSINAMEGAALSAPQLQDSPPGRKDFNIDKQDKGFDELSCESCISMLTPSYEVIIVDDYSKDDTVAVVERWIRDQKRREAPVVTAVSAVGGIGGQDAAGTAATTEERDVSRFTLLSLPANAGPAGARNRGIQQAQGEWIAFLDADDVWLPHRLEAGMHYVRVHPYTAMVCGKSILIGGENSPRMIPTRELEVHYSNTDFLSERKYSLSDFLMVNPVATSTVLIRKDVLIQAGGFDEQFRGPEDYDLWLRVVAISPVVRLEIPVTGYRHRPGSLSLDDRKFLPQVLRVLDKAYARGGVYGSRKGHARAVAYQWLCGAWSAAERGDIRRAVQCFGTSLVHWPWPFRGDQNLKWAKSKVGYYIVRSIVRKSGIANRP